MSVSGITTWLRPATLTEAFDAVREGALPVGGGTDLALHAPRGTTALVDLVDLDLDFVISSDDGYRIGAMTTLTGVMEHPGLAAHLGGVLPEMLIHIGSPLLRNAATVGGHLARARLSDFVPVLIAIGAGITVFDSRGTRSMELETYYERNVFETTHLITEVSVPAAPPRSAAAFQRFSVKGFDIATLNGAITIGLAEDGTVAHARVVLGETPRLGERVPDAEQMLLGRVLEAEVIEETIAIAATEPFGSDSRASAEYRRDLARWVTRHCLQRVAQRLEVV
ncbi:FAD binding domain-containing protein [bacterium]|nr:FAD binding domain-containing protein [bacterium]